MASTDPKRAEFEGLLSTYKQNYVDFVTTGQASYKTAYTNALAAITKAISDHANTYESEKNNLSTFLTNFNTTQSGINSLQNNSSASLENIQKLASDYETTKGQYQQYFGLCEDGTRGCPPPRPGPPTGGDYSRGIKILIALSVLFFIFIFFFIAGYYFQVGAGATPVQQTIQQVANATNAIATAMTPLLTGRPGGMAAPGPPRPPPVAVRLTT